MSAKKPETKYVRQKDTGHVYVWSPELDLRTDMEPCDPPEPREEPEGQTMVLARGVKVEKAADDQAIGADSVRSVPGSAAVVAEKVGDNAAGTPSTEGSKAGAKK